MDRSSKSRIICPTKLNLIGRLKECQIPVSSIVDVGVRECTIELLRGFSDKRQFLFEPACLFHDLIKKNYSAIAYDLFPIALSNVDTDAYVVATSIGNDGIPTHSSIKHEPVPIDGSKVVSCDPLEIRRFDSLNIPVEENYLLKVDVDGLDLEVLMGFGNLLKLASVVIVEVTYSNFRKRSDYISTLGFQLFDIVDLVYYGPSLYQFDCAFVRSSLLSESSRPNISSFDRSLWHPYLG